MTVHTALQFIQEARRDGPLRRKLEALPDEVTMEDLVQVGAAAGLSFTAEELQQAHAHDWRMRWTHFKRAAD
jgi:predicted ribosomally synthesized peptide with nif11-like leader